MIPSDGNSDRNRKTEAPIRSLTPLQLPSIKRSRRRAQTDELSNSGDVATVQRNPSSIHSKDIQNQQIQEASNSASRPQSDSESPDKDSPHSQSKVSRMKEFDRVDKEVSQG
jgi:hypothetical protein